MIIAGWFADKKRTLDRQTDRSQEKGSRRVVGTFFGQECTGRSRYLSFLTDDSPLVQALQLPNSRKRVRGGWLDLMDSLDCYKWNVQREQQNKMTLGRHGSSRHTCTASQLNEAQSCSRPLNLSSSWAGNTSPHVRTASITTPRSICGANGSRVGLSFAFVPDGH